MNEDNRENFKDLRTAQYNVLQNFKLFKLFYMKSIQFFSGKQMNEYVPKEKETSHKVGKCLMCFNRASMLCSWSQVNIIVTSFAWKKKTFHKNVSPLYCTTFASITLSGRFQTIPSHNQSQRKAAIITEAT